MTKPTKGTKPQQECKHVGDKTNFNPQFCQKCGAEFMYDILTAKKPQQDWEKEFNELFLYKDGTNKHLKPELKNGYLLPDLKQFISTERTNAKQEERTKLLNEVRELVEGMPARKTRVFQNTDEVKQYDIFWVNRDYLLQALNKLEGEK